jgi:hypothetical protein
LLANPAGLRPLISRLFSQHTHYPARASLSTVNSAEAKTQTWPNPPKGASSHCQWSSRSPPQHGYSQLTTASPRATLPPHQRDGVRGARTTYREGDRGAKPMPPPPLTLTPRGHSPLPTLLLRLGSSPVPRTLAGPGGGLTSSAARAALSPSHDGPSQSHQLCQIDSPQSWPPWPLSVPATMAHLRLTSSAE